MRGTALDIQAGAVVRSRVDKGDMKRGWTTENVGSHASRVSNPVPHTIFNEKGTDHPARLTVRQYGPLTVYHLSRPYRISAQPMLAPSVAETRPKFISAMGQWYR